MRQAREPEAAVGLGDLAVHEARLPALVADLLREGALLVELSRDGDDLLARELARRVHELLLLLREIEARHRRSIRLPSTAGVMLVVVVHAGSVPRRVHPRAAPRRRRDLSRAPRRAGHHRDARRGRAEGRRDSAETTVMAETSGWRIQQLSLLNRVFAVSRGRLREGGAAHPRAHRQSADIVDPRRLRLEAPLPVRGKAEGVTLTDCGSTNGTSVGEVELPPNKPVALKGGEMPHHGQLLVPLPHRRRLPRVPEARRQMADWPTASR